VCVEAGLEVVGLGGSGRCGVRVEGQALDIFLGANPGASATSDFIRITLTLLES